MPVNCGPMSRRECGAASTHTLLYLVLLGGIGSLGPQPSVYYVEDIQVFMLQFIKTQCKDRLTVNKT